MIRAGLILVTSAVWFVAVAVAAPAAGLIDCRTFIVGPANSTAYRHHNLPARGTVRHASCATLRRIARGLNSGTYRIPSGATAAQPHWGRTFAVRDLGRRWACELQNRGASGPTYAVRCRSGSSRLAWSTG